MFVIATAGHVDHGKSALVKALTGMEPDRMQAERDRGLSIDLGYGWTRLATGEEVAFVDVPGHERFVANTIVGLAPAPAVLFVVAADEGWSRQSQEHLSALDALGISHGLLAVTKADRADPAPVLADAARRLAESSLQQVAAVPVSALTGHGLDELRAALGALADAVPAPSPDARVRLWVDRSFTIRGAGTVVTGTLEQGTITVGDELTLAASGQTLRVRGVQALDRPQQQVSAWARVALNLADISVERIGRGDALVTPAAWHVSNLVDVRVFPVRATTRLPSHATLHVGTHSLQVQLRGLSENVTRLSLPSALPLVVGDRAVLRSPGTGQVLAGVEILDADPPSFHRRGAARRHGTQLENENPTLATEVARRGFMSRAHAQRLGFTVNDTATPDQPQLLRHGDWLIDQDAWQRAIHQLREQVSAKVRTHPLDPTLSAQAAEATLTLPARELLAPLVAAAGLRLVEGRVEDPCVASSLGAAEPGLQKILEHLAADPWAAPERDTLATAGLGAKELAAAARSGRIIRLPGEIVLAPDGPARTMRVLAGLPQPFTLSQARTALGSTRRVVVPLLEYLDQRGWTRRVDSTRREVVRPGVMR